MIQDHPLHLAARLIPLWLWIASVGAVLVILVYDGSLIKILWSSL